MSCSVVVDVCGDAIEGGEDKCEVLSLEENVELMKRSRCVGLEPT